MKKITGNVLELVREIKIGGLVNSHGKRRYEASGVFFKDGYLHIVFDNDPHLLRIRPDWTRAGEEPVLRTLSGTGSGYEDITYHPSARQWYCLIEAAETKPGIYMPRVDAFDESFAFTRSFRLDFPLKHGNKGFEGLSVLHHDGNEYLLCLCEGNNCRGGSAGREAGKGRIQVFRQASGTWEHTGTIRLPELVRFGDYSSLDCRDGCLTVISQIESALWVGRLRAGPDEKGDLFGNDGRLFLFPRDEKGRIVYGNVEGVTWLGENEIAVVSDKAKDNEPGRRVKKDQSVHIFRLPDAGLPAE